MMRIATEVWTMTVIVDIVQITITTIDTVTTMNQMIGKNSNIKCKTMKKSLFISCLIAMLMVSCGTKEETWEYKVVKVAGKDAEIMADYGSLVYGDQTTMLNKMGKEGWELVSTYTEVATAFPNFGNSEYVTGIRENVRTSVVNFVFKRPSTGQDEVKPAKVDVKPELDSELKDTPDTEQKEQKK